MDDTQESVDCMPLLVDLLEGGVYGGSTMERRHSANMTLEAARRGKRRRRRRFGHRCFRVFLI